MKTLKPIALHKIAQRFVDNLRCALYTMDGSVKQMPIFNADVEDNIVRIYIYFDEEVGGSLTQVELVDKDGDVVAVAEREFIKPQEMGLYVAFKYKFTEEEVENVEGV